MSFLPGIFLAPVYPGNTNDVGQAKIDSQNKFIDTNLGNIDFRGKPVSVGKNVLVAIVKKNSKKVLIVPCDQIHAFALKQTVVEAEEEQKLNRQSITETFGLTKQKRALAKSKRALFDLTFTSDADKIHASVLENEKSSTNTDFNMSHDSSPETVALEMLPPHDLKADIVNKIYDISWIAPERCCEALVNEGDVIKKATVEDVLNWMKINKFPKVLLKRIMSLPANETGTTISRIWAFWDAMYTLYGLNKRCIARKVPLPGVNDIVSTFLLDRYTVVVETSKGSQRTMTSLDKNRLLVHLLVLVLSLHDYNMILDELLMDLRIGTDKLKKLFKFIGCKVVAGSKKSIQVTLTAPLTLTNP